MIEKVIGSLASGRHEEARWLVEAVLHMNGVSKAQSSSTSTLAMVPLSAVDLPTLVDMLLEIPTLQDPSADSTWRSRLKSARDALKKSNGTDSGSGQAKQNQPAQSSTTQSRPLPSNRKYWPGDAKDTFWSLVRLLNKYDKENMEGGQRSPLQLSVAEAVTRRCWNLERIDEPVVSDADRALVVGLAQEWEVEFVPWR